VHHALNQSFAACRAAHRIAASCPPGARLSGLRSLSGSLPALWTAASSERPENAGAQSKLA